MKEQLIPYHFTRNIGKDFNNFFEKVVRCKGVICFDFEDSIQAEDQEQIPVLKTSRRRDLINQILECCTPEHLKHLGFRINKTESSYYAADLENIAALGKINCIFLPKVENKEQVEKLLLDLPANVKEIIPIIETQKGFENMPAILAVKDPRFLRFAFGHCDLNLSNGFFPFFHQQTPEFWNWVAQLDYEAKLAGKQLLNSPVLDLENAAFFSRVLARNRNFSSISGQITLCLKQTLLCAESETYDELPLQFPNSGSQCKNELARETIENFTTFKDKESFFAVNTNRVLISPQEYVGAQATLNIFAL